MKINWCGDSCFEIQCTSKDKENVLTIVDPKEGKKFDKADIILETHPLKSGFKTGEQFVVSSCGEYERKEIFIQGINSLQLDKKTPFFNDVFLNYILFFKKLFFFK